MCVEMKGNVFLDPVTEALFRFLDAWSGSFRADVEEMLLLSHSGLAECQTCTASPIQPLQEIGRPNNLGTLR